MGLKLLILFQHGFGRSFAYQACAACDKNGRTLIHEIELAKRESYNKKREGDCVE
jgi:hypothetical protein